MDGKASRSGKHDDATPPASPPSPSPPPTLPSPGYFSRLPAYPAARRVGEGSRRLSAWVSAAVNSKGTC
jgi:hypothetical protein